MGSASSQVDDEHQAYFQSSLPPNTRHTSVSRPADTRSTVLREDINRQRSRRSQAAELNSLSYYVKGTNASEDMTSSSSTATTITSTTITTMTHPPPSSSCPLLVDHDIHSTVDTILTTFVTNHHLQGDQDSKDVRYKATRRASRAGQARKQYGQCGNAWGPEVYSGLLDCVTHALQKERNGWKERLHSTLQELDRQHKDSLTVHSHLQELADTLGLTHWTPEGTMTTDDHHDHHNHHDHQDHHHDLHDHNDHHDHQDHHNDHNDDHHDDLDHHYNHHDDHHDDVNDGTEVPQGQGDKNGRRPLSLHILRALQGHVRDLQDAAKGICWDQDLQWSVECLQRSLARAEEEREGLEQVIQQKTAEVRWLDRELTTVQHQLHRLQVVVLNYNTAHSTAFRLDYILHPNPTPPPQRPVGVKNGSDLHQPDFTKRDLKKTYVSETGEKPKQSQPSHKNNPQLNAQQRDLLKKDLHRYRSQSTVNSEGVSQPSGPDQDALVVALCGPGDPDVTQPHHDKSCPEDDDPKRLQHFLSATRTEDDDPKRLQHFLSAKRTEHAVLRTTLKLAVKFHTGDTELPSTCHEGHNAGNKNASLRQRIYVEGDRAEDFVTPAAELAVWKQRVKHKVVDVRGRGRGSGITQCLRCQQLFRAKENNPRACRYHHKGREIRELYDGTGRLTRVLYKWACCKKGLDKHGCVYGYHV